MSNDNQPGVVSNRKYYGKHRGTVVNNVDPMFRGRLLVQVPSVVGLQPVWALPCVPYAGVQQGLFALPDPGTPVWIEFEEGDPSLPIWVGCFWKPGDLLPTDAIPTVKFFKAKGLSIRFDEAIQQIVISAPGTSVRIDPTQILLVSSAVNAQAGPRSTNLTFPAFTVNLGGLTVT
ncbi:phage baseplate assembly protein V [Paraliomyxa miuraensis]|uniref:phage baseplate assembly protein V n=1 Tax=Paraliomyxa miuraensis TaxID=376150 RepID=UPI0022592EBB|nr:phage baseplate assembly protein V [Paraliomyxa miuraensis]MCX4247464.1 phage baseplate assembly protein V [Paraliomyxa miuraensis]